MEAVDLGTLLRRKRDAQDALDHPGVVRALETVARDAHDRFEHSAPDAASQRDAAYQVLFALRCIVETLKHTVEEADAETLRQRHAEQPPRTLKV